ncbi:unnamed protein product, partial [Mycena citricolor]
MSGSQIHEDPSSSHRSTFLAVFNSRARRAFNFRHLSSLSPSQLRHRRLSASSGMFGTALLVPCRVAFPSEMMIAICGAYNYDSEVREIREYVGIHMVLAENPRTTAR